MDGLTPDEGSCGVTSLRRPARYTERRVHRVLRSPSSQASSCYYLYTPLSIDEISVCVSAQCPLVTPSASSVLDVRSSSFLSTLFFLKLRTAFFGLSSGLAVVKESGVPSHVAPLSAHSELQCFSCMPQSARTSVRRIPMDKMLSQNFLASMRPSRGLVPSVKGPPPEPRRSSHHYV